MLSANHRRWLFWTLAAIVATVVAPFAADYSAMKHIQAMGRKLRIGMSAEDVRKAVGPPSLTGTGWFGLATPGYQATDTVWSYHTKFGWIGDDSLSSPDFRPRWKQLLFPASVERNVLTIWFRDGKVIGVTTPEGTIVE